MGLNELLQEQFPLHSLQVLDCLEKRCADAGENLLRELTMKEDSGHYQLTSFIKDPRGPYYFTLLVRQTLKTLRRE
jgi:hypothetical protein